jgi:hypothetical protein
MTNKETTGREVFEREFECRKLGRHPEHPDHYQDFGTQLAWEGWQAASFRSNEKQGVDGAEIIEAAKNLVKVKGRFHTEQAFKRLELALATHPTTEKKEAGNE